MKTAGNNTYREINSQPLAWGECLERISHIDLGSFPKREDFDQIIFTGCGSTFYLSLWAARATQTATGRHCLAVPSSELWLNPEAWLVPTQKCLVIAISRSGSTSETVAAVKRLNQNENGASIVITCYPDSELAGLSPARITLPDAQEVSIAQTRSFTSMMLAAAYLAESSYPPSLYKELINQAQSLFQREKHTASAYGKDKGISRFFFLGSGARYGLACEAMLKMKEMSLSYSEAYHFLEFRHGPMSMVDSNSLVVGLLGRQATSYEIDVLKDMRDLGSKVLALGPKQAADSVHWLDHFIALETDELGMLGEVLYMPILQLIAFERALTNDRDPDKPNNLTAVVVLEA
jgi:glucosamine--fructose-6-phosphate aminotransferase (isomerizing)